MRLYLHALSRSMRLHLTPSTCACCNGLSRGIHKLDVEGMEAISSRDVRAFEAYLRATGNT